MDIKKYLKYVMELEQSKYTIDKSISYLNAKQNGLVIKNNMKNPKNHPTEESSVLFLQLPIWFYC